MQKNAFDRLISKRVHTLFANKSFDDVYRFRTCIFIDSHGTNRVSIFQDIIQLPEC